MAVTAGVAVGEVVPPGVTSGVAVKVGRGVEVAVGEMVEGGV